MSATTRTVFAASPSMQRITSEAAWTPQLVAAMRKLLDTPIGDPAMLSCVAECRALLSCYDEDQEPATQTPT